MPAPKILLVDDEPEQLVVRSLLVTQHGMASLLADGPQTALQLAELERPSLVVMDLRLPTTQSGCQLIRDLKQLRPAMKILVLTGRKISLARAPELGMVEAVVEKGSPAKQLLQTIQRLCD